MNPFNSRLIDFIFMHKSVKGDDWIQNQLKEVLVQNLDLKMPNA